jgi:hypothetical protein
MKEQTQAQQNQNQFKNWREKFKLVDCEWSWRKLSSNYKHWVNEEYSGGETTTIYAPSHRIEKLMDEIQNVNPDLLNLIKEVYIRYWVGNEFRGSGPARGFIKGDKDFLSKLIKVAYFEWIDVAWGDWAGTLEYNKEFLESLRKRD